MTRQQLDETLAVHRDVELVDVGPGDDGFSEVRDRAVVAAGLSFTISDPRLPDNPLVFVNPAFERTTGYSRDEAQGRNCRFLQGPETDPADVQHIRDAVAAQEHVVVTLLNYRKDGTAFCEHLIRELAYGDLDDDIALLVVRVLE